MSANSTLSAAPGQDSTTPKTRRPGLLVRIITGMALGICLGFFMPEWFARLAATFNGIFSQFLGFLIPLIIIGFVTPAIADIGSKAGKMLVATALLAYAMTVMSGLLSYFTSAGLFPGLLSYVPAVNDDLTEEAASLAPYISVPIPELCNVMTALVLSFMLGLGMAYTKSCALKKGFDDLLDIVGKTINKVVIPLLPFYIFGIFLIMTVENKIGKVMSAFALVIVVIFVMSVVLLILQYSIAGIVARRNPFKMLRSMLPAYFTALGTQSSAATIPVTLRQAIKMGVSEEVAGFTIPLCATIHLSGSTLKIVACALTLMILHHQPYSFPMFINFIALLGVTMVAAPGIPGGAIMASLGLLGSVLGFSSEDCAMMIALYITMDSFGTACNVTGDGAIAVIIDRFFRSKAIDKTSTCQ